MNATGAEQMLTLGGARGVVRDNGARDGHMQQGVRKAGGAMSLGGVIQDAEVRSGGRNRGAVIDQGVDHLPEPQSVFFEANSKEQFTERCQLREQTYLVRMRWPGKNTNALTQKRSSTFGLLQPARLADS